MAIETLRDFAELKHSIDFKKFIHVGNYPKKQSEVKAFKEKFTLAQSQAPFSVKDFSEDITDNGGILCDVVQYFPFQIKFFNEKMLNDYDEMSEFFEWWFGKVIYSLSDSRKKLYEITKFYFQITDKDYWFYSNMLALGLLDFSGLPKKVQTQEFVNSLLSNDEMKNKINSKEVSIPEEFHK